MVSQLSSQEIDDIRQTVEDHFHYWCRIELSVDGVVDAAGHPTETWELLYDGPCNYSEEASIEMIGSVEAVVVDARVILPANLAVDEGDRITQVIGPDNTVIATNLNIRSVLDRIANVICLVQEVR